MSPSGPICYLLSGHIVHIGKNRIDTITPDHIRYMLQAMKKNGLSGRICQATFFTLSGALKDAVREGKIPHNPRDRMDASRANSTEGQAFSRAEFAGLLRVIEDGPLMMRARWMMALTIGASQGINSSLATGKQLIT